MTALDRAPPLVSGQEKVTAHHLERLAYIYIRQSSPGQVANNKESQINQARMAQRAEGLGWRPDRIRIIDTDQGVSGKHSGPRSGFQELVAEVSLGRAGIIFGYEVSRLARNNSDWYRLLDLTAVFDTLIADYDGIYDLNLFNDRLLLGLKGTVSEAELHLLRLRMDAGRMRQIERGAYRHNLPTGLVRLPDGSVVKDPDDQVRHTIELVFVQFEALGSARQVFCYLRDANVRLPRRHTAGIHTGQLLWKRTSPGAVYAILTNPAYAGAFAYGRTQVDPARRQSGRSRTGRVKKPMEQWTYVQQDVYPAYITWEQYLTNQARLRQNATRFRESTQPAQGASRKGAALLQGLVSCGKCGHRIRVVYRTLHRYRCQDLTRRLGEPICASLDGPPIDAAVVQAFFDAIQPAQLDALEAILADQQAEQARLARHWEERLKRARYEAHLAQRQFDATDPDNRLVAAELERRWEEKLRQLQETQTAHEHFQKTSTPPTLSPEQCEQFRHISDTLPGLWESGQLSNDHKKELLRSLISRVILTRPVPEAIEVKIVWVSGHYSTISVASSIYLTRDVPGYQKMVARIKELWQQGYDDTRAASQLTAEGFRSARSTVVNPWTVRDIRLKHGWKLTQSPNRTRRLFAAEGYVTISELATRLGVSRKRFYRRIDSGQIGVIRHPKYNVFLIQDDPKLMEDLRQQLEDSRRTNGGI
jgi:DNA invertase Pin-like site-specific DNA recombinase